MVITLENSAAWLCPPVKHVLTSAVYIPSGTTCMHILLSSTHSHTLKVKVRLELRAQEAVKDSKGKLELLAQL